MRDINDVGRIQYVLDNYDSVSDGGRSSSYTTNKQNGEKGTAKTVVFEKAVNGTYYVVEAVPDTAAKTTYIVSAYMSKKGAKKAAPSSVFGNNAPSDTSETARRVAADDNVSQIDADVNTSRECEESLPQSATLTAPSEVQIHEIEIVSVLSLRGQGININKNQKPRRPGVTRKAELLLVNEIRLNRRGHSRKGSDGREHLCAAGAFAVMPQSGYPMVLPPSQTKFAPLT